MLLITTKNSIYELDMENGRVRKRHGIDDTPHRNVWREFYYCIPPRLGEKLQILFYNDKWLTTSIVKGIDEY